MKKGLLLLSALLLLLSAKTFSQTSVSGKLTKNTTWTAAASPYLLTDDVIVPATIQLTIMPGVTINRSDKSQIAVSGSLIAVGSESDSIHLVTDDLTDANVAAFFEFSQCDLSQSSLRFLSFQGNNLQTKNIRIGSEKESSSTIKNSGIITISRSNLSDGNVVSHGFNSAISMNIDSCYFDSSEIHSSDAYSEKINITNSVIENSTELADGLSFGITNTNCTILNSIIESGANTSISLSSSTITNSGFTVPNDAILSMSNCTAANSPVIAIPGGTVNIDASKFSANNEDTSLYPKIGDIPYLVTAFQANITNTTFSGINGIDAIAIKGTGTDTTTVVSHNTFSGFENAVTVYNFSNDIHIDSNNFETTKTYDIINYSDKNFDAIYNYYALSGGQSVNDVIYDKRDNSAYGLVNYTPYANEPVLPLQLISFTGAYNNHEAILKWQTANEINTSKFIVQYGVNGTYEDIGTVTAKGGASNSYSFLPNSITGGNNIYRLKMIDANGTYTYSGAVTIDVSTLSLAFAMYPNPATHFIIVTHAKANDASQLQLADISGKIIKSMAVAKDDTQNKMMLTGIAKGTYQVIWRNGASAQSQTLLIQ